LLSCGFYGLLDPLAVKVHFPFVSGSHLGFCKPAVNLRAGKLHTFLALFYANDRWFANAQKSCQTTLGPTALEPKLLDALPQ
jgi:hypothetical protein